MACAIKTQLIGEISYYMFISHIGERPEGTKSRLEYSYFYVFCELSPNRAPAVDDFLARQLLTLAYTINHPGGNDVALANNHSSCAAHSINHPSCATTFTSGAF
jgi:hypothetical protein